MLEHNVPFTLRLAIVPATSVSDIVRRTSWRYRQLKFTASARLFIAATKHCIAKTIFNKLPLQLWKFPLKFDLRNGVFGFEAYVKAEELNHEMHQKVYSATI